MDIIEQEIIDITRSTQRPRLNIKTGLLNSSKINKKTNIRNKKQNQNNNYNLNNNYPIVKNKMLKKKQKKQTKKVRKNKNNDIYNTYSPKYERNPLDYDTSCSDHSFYDFQNWEPDYNSADDCQYAQNSVIDMIILAKQQNQSGNEQLLQNTESNQLMMNNFNSQVSLQEQVQNNQIQQQQSQSINIGQQYIQTYNQIILSQEEEITKDLQSKLTISNNAYSN